LKRYEDITFGSLFASRQRHVPIQVPNKFAVSAVSTYLPFSLFFLSNRPILSSQYRCVTLCVHKTIPRGYRIIEPRISQRRHQRKRRAKHRLKLFIYYGGREGKRSVKRVSANIANQLLSNLPFALAVFR